MKTYWTMKNGQQIDVDEMDEQHLRNTLKMLIRKEQKKEKKHNEWYLQPDEFNELASEYDAEDFGCK